MAYVPITVTDAIPRTAQLMNYIETQYAQAKIDIDIHDHDTAYYPKATADARFFQGGVVKPDADKIDGLHWNEIVGSLLPIGSVVGWNGTDANVPANWHIADGGTYSGTVTPDTRGLFILGAGKTYAALSTGGAASISDAGGAVTVSGHTLTIAELPSHYHDWTDTYGPGGVTQNYTGYPWLPASLTTTTTRVGTTDYNHSAADESHNHGTKEITLNSFNIIPLFVAKYFICKVQ